MTYFYKLDDQGFFAGQLHESMVNDANRPGLVDTPVPDTELTGFQKWLWANGAWAATDDLRGHTWYNPDNTDQEHAPTQFDDQPPAGWLYWAPGENKVISQAELTAKEWVKVRARRNRLLVESDWTDTLSAKDRLGEALYNEWQTYRQALRDITLQPDPFNLTWPTPP